MTWNRAIPPKFKVGEKVTWKGGTFIVKSINTLIDRYNYRIGDDVVVNEDELHKHYDADNLPKNVVQYDVTLWGKEVKPLELFGILLKIRDVYNSTSDCDTDTWWNIVRDHDVDDPQIVHLIAMGARHKVTPFNFPTSELAEKFLKHFENDLKQLERLF